jgi:hypothetical protein
MLHMRFISQDARLRFLDAGVLEIDIALSFLSRFIGIGVDAWWTNALLSCSLFPGSPCCLDCDWGGGKEDPMYVESPVSCISREEGNPVLTLSSYSIGENDLHSGEKVSSFSLMTIPQELQSISPMELSVITKPLHAEQKLPSGK